MKLIAQPFICCLVMLFAYQPGASAVMVNLDEHALREAVAAGMQQGAAVTGHLREQYGFGTEGLFEEHGIIRTKRAKLVLLAGLLAARGTEPTVEEQQRILDSTDLQIDMYTYGNRLDFARAYSLHLVQNGTIIEPHIISADHAACQAEKSMQASGFPKYRATLRAYFPYARINPLAHTVIVLVKDGRQVSLEVNLAGYK